MDALRNLDRTEAPNRTELIKRNVDRYVKDEIGGRQRALERLRQAIDGEDWSVAKDCVRSLRNMMADLLLGCCLITNIPFLNVNRCSG